MKAVWVGIGVGGLHLLTSHVVFALLFGQALRRFDNGDPATVFEHGLENVLSILCFPFSHSMVFWSSILWGTFACVVFKLVERRRTRLQT